MPLWLGWSTCVHAQAPGSRVATTAPVKGYSVSFFSDEGYRKVRLRGDSADLANPEQVVLTNMELTAYSGDESMTEESVLRAPTAVLEPQTELVFGPASVQLNRPGLELTGEQWSYDHAAKTIHIRARARIVINDALDHLLQ